jgi:hypothetical protein
VKYIVSVLLAAGVAACASGSRTSASPAQPTTSGQPATVTTRRGGVDSTRDVFVQTRVSVGDSFSPQRGDAALKAFRPDVSADLTGGECNLLRTGGSGATIVTAYFPSRPAVKTQMTLSFDSAGHLIRFNERRGVPKMPSMVGMTPEQRDSTIRVNDAAMRTTNLSLDYAIDQGVVLNRGAGRPTTAILGTVRAVEALEQLGPPKDHVERARRLCGV